MDTQQLPSVLFLHPSDEMYGADRQLLALVRASRHRCRPLVLLPDDLPYEGRLTAALRAEGISVMSGPLPVFRRRYARPVALAGWGWRALRGTWWSWRLARKHEARLIVSNSTAIPVGPLLARLRRGRHIWFVREFIESPGWFRAFIRSAARISPGRILTVSKAVASWLGRVPAHGPDVLHDGVRINGSPDPLPSEPDAVFVGRLSEWKGWDVFVDAARIAHAAVPNATFRLVGGTASGSTVDERTVADRIDRAADGNDWLRWDGEAEDVAGVMAGSWAVVVPSKRPDPFPNVVLEGMERGRAVIGSEVGGIPEMIIDGVTGLTVAPGDVGALAAAMTSVLTNADVAASMGMAGRSRVEREFSSEQFQERWRETLGAHLRDAG